MVSFKVQGFDQALAALAKKSEDIGKRVDIEMTATAYEINAEQIARTPVDTGTLRSANEVETSKYLHKILRNRKEYSPYVEFGTGGLVDIPLGMEEYASQFKGTQGKKRNGRAQPFFFPPFFRLTKQMIERIKKIVNE